MHNIIYWLFGDIVKFVLAIILLFFFPIGTIISIFIFWHLYASNKKLNQQIDQNKERLNREKDEQRAADIKVTLGSKYGQKIRKIQELDKKKEQLKIQTDKQELTKQKEIFYLEHSILLDFLMKEAGEISKLPFVRASAKFTNDNLLEFTFRIEEITSRASLRISVNQSGKLELDSALLNLSSDDVDAVNGSSYSLAVEKKLDKLFVDILSQFSPEL